MSLQLNYGHINLSRQSATNVSNFQANHQNNITDQQVVLLPTQKDFIEHYVVNGEEWDAAAIMAKRSVIAQLSKIT